MIAGLIAPCLEARADTLWVRPDRGTPTLSQAIAAASPGDIVQIQPGRYFQCAIVNVPNLTIEGVGDGTTLSDTTCQGKALLVIAAPGVVIRDLTLTRARVADRNGAGIRAEGGDLTIERVRFVNNESGLMSADSPDASITIRDSAFIDNGRCIDRCAHAILTGRLRTLRIEHTRFSGTKQGDAIQSHASRTELLDNDIEDGPDGTAGVLVDLVEGGDLVMRGNRLRRGPGAGSAQVVTLGAWSPGPPDADQVIEKNVLRDDSSRVRALVLDWGAATPHVSGNTVPAGVEEVSSRGLWLHRIRSRLGHIKNETGRVVGALKRLAARVIR